MVLYLLGIYRVYPPLLCNYVAHHIIAPVARLQVPSTIRFPAGILAMGFVIVVLIC